MNFKIILLIFAISLLSCSSTQRDKRTLKTAFLQYFNGGKCARRSCPPWKCQDDSAVIHGFCCHCPGSEYDNVPIPCYPDLKCPVSPQELCADYNFMMDCCCTGP